MSRLRYSAVVTLALWTALAPAGATAQEMTRGDESSVTLRRFLLPLPQAPQTSQPRPVWVVPARVTAEGDMARAAVGLRAQGPRSARSERGLGRKVLGGVVGAAGGFFAGGYIGSRIEGHGCHCDDPGLKGVMIGAPIGAAAGGILGALYLF